MILIKIVGLAALLLFGLSNIHLAQAGDPPTPVHFDDFNPLDYKTVPTRSWIKPNYSGQKDIIGYRPQDFEISEQMSERVEFWINVYSKYFTHQGVIHDARNIEVVHAVVDFSDINGDEKLSERQKTKKRRKRVDTEKKKVKKVLLSLHGVSSAKQLKGERLKKFLQYEDVKEKDKFKIAASKDNLRFQLGQRDRFLQAMYYSGRYIQQMEKIFQANGLPKELVRMAYVESSFNIAAISRVGASGLFQIMPRTGRQYLKINRSVDFRNHPMEATRAASKLLKFYYKMLNSWPLAITGYNHGAYGVKKLTRKFGTRDIAKLVNSKAKARRFGFASRNFYATFLAAVHVEKNADEIFGEIKWAPKLVYADVKNKHLTDWKTVVGWFSGDKALARLYNPHLTSSVRKGYRPIPIKTTLHVPLKMHSKAIADLKKKIRVAMPKFANYKIRRGDTLGKIARRFRTSIRRLKNINGIGRSNLIRAGKRLKVPN